MILNNAAKCLNCGDEIFSSHRHDFKYCSCGDISVDGGMEYIKRGYKDVASYIDLSIEVSELELTMCLSALEWCDDNNRNNLGRVCAIFRALRDSGYLDRPHND